MDGLREGLFEGKVALTVGRTEGMLVITVRIDTVTEASVGEDAATTPCILLAVKLDVTDVASEGLKPATVTNKELEEVVKTLRDKIAVTAMFI